MKTYKKILSLLTVLLMLAGCQEYSLNIPFATQDSVLDKLKGTTWVTYIQEDGIVEEDYFAPTGLTLSTFAYFPATNATLTHFFDLEETKEDSYVVKNEEMDMTYKVKIISPNHIESTSYDVATKEWTTTDDYRLLRTVGGFSTRDVITTEDLGVESLDDIEILTKSNLTIDWNREVIVPISAGVAYIKVECDDPYMIKLDIVDYNAAGYLDNFYLPHYEHIIGKWIDDIEEMYGQKYTYAENDDYSCMTYITPITYESYMTSVLVYLDSDEAYEVMLVLKEDTPQELVKLYLENAYSTWEVDEPNGCYYYTELGKTYKKCNFVLMYNPEDQIILFQYHKPVPDFEIQDFSKYLYQTLDDLQSLWGQPNDTNEDMGYVSYNNRRNVRTEIVQRANFYYTDKKYINKINVFLYSIDGALEYMTDMYGQGIEVESGCTWTDRENYRIQLLYRSKAITYTALKAPEDDKDPEWKSLGTMDFTDIFITSLHNNNPTYEVEVQEHIDKPGLYRLVNPYGANCPFVGEAAYDNTQPHYIEIDATDPDFVWIKRQWTGVVTTQLGKVYLMNKVGSFQHDTGAGDDISFLKGMMPSWFGKKEGNVITFPAYTIIFELTGGTNFEAGKYYDNEDDVTLTLPSKKNSAAPKKKAAAKKSGLATEKLKKAKTKKGIANQYMRVIESYKQKF